MVPCPVLPFEINGVITNDVTVGSADLSNSESLLVLVTFFCNAENCFQPSLTVGKEAGTPFMSQNQE